jgi:hypothetical protein
MGMAVHFTHLALVILAMDLCFNKEEVYEAEIKAEVKAALLGFENPRYPSPLVARFLESLKDVLERHKVQFHDQLTTTRGDSNSISNDGQMNFTQFGQEVEVFDLDTTYDEFWKIAMQDESNTDLLSWDNMFSAIDSRPF